MTRNQKLVTGAAPAALALGFLGWLSTLMSAGRLPEPMATHWNAAGSADGFASQQAFLLLSGLLILVPAAIWWAVLWSPKLPGTPRGALLAVVGVLLLTMLSIQTASILAQRDLSDASLARLEFPVLLVFLPVALMLWIFLAKPQVSMTERLTVTLRGLPMFRCGLDEIDSVSVSQVRGRDFGGFGLRFSKGKVAFMPSPGKALQIATKAGQTILIRSEQADQQAEDINRKLGK